MMQKKKLQKQMSMPINPSRDLTTTETIDSTDEQERTGKFIFE